MKYYYRYMIKQEILTRPKKVIHRACINTLGLYSPCYLELTASALPDSYTKKSLNNFLKYNQVPELCIKQIWEF